jgi:Tol biopolymer transport system component
MKRSTQDTRMSRRDFVRATAAGGVAAAIAACSTPGARAPKTGPEEFILFNSNRRIGCVPADGGEVEFWSFDVPNQVSWQAGSIFEDRERMIVMSFEGKKTWEHNVRCHTWIYNRVSGTLTEIAKKNPPSPFMTPGPLLPGEERIIMSPIYEHEQRLTVMNLDGSDQVHVTKEGEGFTYGVQPSPDGARFAFHVAGPGNYRICVTNVDGSGRITIAEDPGHLYFGPEWSPDGEWLVYVDCHSKTYPGHDWADLCLGRPDGSEHRVVTEGQRQWFGTSHGNPKTRGGGSDTAKWAPNRNVCSYTRKQPGSRTAWPYQEARPDTDHFNRDYQPENARGGTEICVLDPFTKEVQQLTPSTERVWDFRPTWSPSGDRIAFCRAPIGKPQELWVMDADGSNARFLTRGIDDMGADFPRWV